MGACCGASRRFWLTLQGERRRTENRYAGSLDVALGREGGRGALAEGAERSRGGTAVAGTSNPHLALRRLTRRTAAQSVQSDSKWKF